MNDQAGQREVIAENLQANVLRELNILVKDFKEDRKKHLQEGARLMATLTGQIGNLERARKAYEKAFREAERAVENYQRADADLHLSRAEVGGFFNRPVNNRSDNHHHSNNVYFFFHSM